MILKVGWSPVGFSLLAFLLDQVLFLAAYNVAFILNLPRRVPDVSAETWYLLLAPYIYEPGYFTFLPIAWAVVVFFLVIFGTYRNAFHTTFNYQSRQAMKGILLGCMTLYSGIFLLGVDDVGRDFGFTLLGFLLILIPLFKLLVGDLRLVLKKLGVGRVRTLLAGEAEELLKLHRRVVHQMGENYDIVGLVPEGEPGELANLDVPVFDMDTDREELLGCGAHQLLYPEPVPDEAHLEGVRRFCREHRVALKLIPVEQTVAVGETRVHDLLGVPLEMTSPPTRLGVRRVLKRLIDLVGATVALILCAPLMVLVAVLLKVDSRGPIFFMQERLTLNGRRFRIIKFRSMYVDAEERLAALRAKSEVSGPIFKMKHDPRVTRVGRWIRKLSIDELPQFFNVLQGTLSLVGPRPPLPKEVEGYEPWQKRRLEVVSGITGLWQVSGRSMIDFEEMVLLDLYYIENWSLLLDLEILLDTLPTVLLGKGAF